LFVVEAGAQECGDAEILLDLIPFFGRIEARQGNQPGTSPTGSRRRRTTRPTTLGSPSSRIMRRSTSGRRRRGLAA
jgi:hypothetical protein